MTERGEVGCDPAVSFWRQDGAPQPRGDPRFGTLDLPPTRGLVDNGHDGLQLELAVNANKPAIIAPFDSAIIVTPSSRERHVPTALRIPDFADPDPARNPQSFSPGLPGHIIIAIGG